jgi:hypothetical protein
LMGEENSLPEEAAMLGVELGVELASPNTY